MSNAPTRVIAVEIQGMRYPIRSALEPSYVTSLARYVDAKMGAAAQEVEAGDSVRIAVLAALNIADELFRHLEERGVSHSELLQRATALERLVDLALEARLHPGGG